MEWETCQNLRDQDEPDVPLISDKDGDRKVIKWVPIFLDSLTRTYVIHGPLVYVLCEDPTVPNEFNDPLEHESYFGASVSLHEELMARLVHTGAIYKNDNTSVFMKIERESRGTSVESTVPQGPEGGRGWRIVLLLSRLEEVPLFPADNLGTFP